MCQCRGTTLLQTDDRQHKKKERSDYITAL